MEGISLRMEKTVILPSATARTDYFRPYGIKRALTDLTVLPRKRQEKDTEGRQTSRGNHVPVVSVQYDVPRTPPSPLMYRFRRLHTPLSSGQTSRPKSEDRIISAPVCSTVLEFPSPLYDRLPEYPLKRSARIERRLEEEKKRKQQDQVAVNVESHRLKGLGVGKCYSEYHPPPTAPETVQRQGFAPSTPSLSNSRASQRTSVMPSPLSQNQQSATSRQSTYTLPSQKQSSRDRANLQNAQTSAIKQITNIYNSRPKTNNKDKEIENKVQNQKSMMVHHPTYLHSPMLFSQSHHPGNHEARSQVYVNGEVQGHPNRAEGQGQEDADKMYAAYQNVKTDYGSYLNEYNNSSSTPTVPYSTADILYGNEVNGSRGQQNEDVRQNSFGDMEKSRELARSRSKELEQNPNNRRPSSKSGKQRSLTIDSVVPFDKDREDPLRSLSSALPPAKPSHHFRPNGIRTNIMKPDQLYSSKPNGAVPGRDQDDLVAMGTLWSPNNNSSGQPPPVGSSSAVSHQQQQQQQQSSNRNSSVSNSNTNSFPSKVVSSSSSVNHSMSSSNNTLNTQRKYPGNNIRPIQVQNNVSGRKNSNSTKEQEDPKYTDPMIGAPASFQQRIIELGALEGDTVRWERSKRLKKKKQDRDS
ncbi:putative uncharacterized protein DDB_G0279653 isoform X2 [Mercenaria mercenaria]|uniref:putative uncharacterized protein DDB_G0279653 isoform X2 n=1 Tax=Mercenaria mercenaria TaxID=6596 RepID=UPI00234F1AD2|nr:putative uncharacterized protein DDB_G0279653 isoform X2 [Mercenaria mercenaria]